MSDTQNKITDIVNEFDRWLANQVLENGLSWEELPQLNDAFREYFKGTRTAKLETKITHKTETGYGLINLSNGKFFAKNPWQNGGVALYKTKRGAEERLGAGHLARIAFVTLTVTENTDSSAGTILPNGDVVIDGKTVGKQG